MIKHPHRPEAERFWNFPQAAIEEAVVNAVYHRSYEIREPVEIRITGEDLVVLSFPGPDRSIKLADLQAGKAISRRYRNRRIGEFLKELELTEGRSTGLSKIFRAMKANGSPPPEFDTDEDRSYFLLRLPVHPKAVHPKFLLGATDVSAETSGKTSGKILQHMRENAHITIPELAAALGITERSVERNIQKLQLEGMIRRLGPAKGGHWEVTNIE
ncbi:MAG: winged helix-turn-helix transcriptional regulator [Gammaproteobacteria bacterium]|nr:winged helix-turn-helix transcriptional regulator [Gammaproteobacteria bacterium]